MQFAFADREAENIYQQYYSNEKRSDFKVLLQILLVTNAVLLMLFGFQAFNTRGSSVSGYNNEDNDIPSTEEDSLRMMMADEGSSSLTSNPSVFLSSRYDYSEKLTPITGLVVSFISLIIIVFLYSAPSSGKRIWSILPVLIFVLEVSHVICDLWMFPVSRSASDSVSLVLLYTYSIYVIFPMRFRFCLFMALILDVIHVSLVVTAPHQQDSLLEQVRIF